MPEQQRQCNTVTPTHEATYVATDCCKRCSAVHGGVKFTTTKLMENRQTCTYVNNLWKSRWMGGGEQTFHGRRKSLSFYATARRCASWMHAVDVPASLHCDVRR